MKKKRILTVDDSTSVRRAVSEILTQAGFEVIEAVDGLDGLEKLDGDPDMILCDVNMPRMNGLEMIRAAREREHCKFIPIIMLTTESMNDIREQGKLAGASAWITKPFGPDDLLAIVTRYMR